MEIEELVKLLILVVVLILAIGIIVLLIGGKGGDLMVGIKNLLHFGK